MISNEMKGNKNKQNRIIIDLKGEIKNGKKF